MAKISSNFVVANTHGLHARPAMLLAKAAGRYQAEVSIRNGGGFVDGKSVLALLSIGASQGTKLTVVAEGCDAQEAMREIKDLFAASFGE